MAARLRTQRRFRGRRPPRHLLIVPYLGHGSAGRVVVRGRVLDHLPPSAAVAGEGTGAAVRRSVARFAAAGLPGVLLTIRVGTASTETVTDRDGYFDAELATGAVPDSPWCAAEVELARPYRGITDLHTTQVRVRLPAVGARFGVISDVDDTILHTGAQHVVRMVRTTLTGSALTRTPFAGAAALYQALAASPGGSAANPVFYVSSSPWPLHDFLIGFLAHRDFPLGPLLLRNLRASGSSGPQGGSKRAHIDEVLRLHPHLSFVLVGDSGQSDPDIYAEVARRHSDRILAIYIREVRLDPGDRRVESVTDGWHHAIPFVLAADSTAVAEHAAGLGLISPEAVRSVRAAMAGPG